MTVAGPTSCGKTTWINNLLQQAITMIRPSPHRIVWYYKRWQPMYTEMQQSIPNIKFVQGISMEDDNGVRYPTLLVFDD